MKNQLSLFINALVIIVLAVGLGRIAATQSGTYLYFGLLFVVLLVALGFFGLTRLPSTGRKWLLATYTVVILALMAITFLSELKVALLLAALLGFLVSFPQKRRSTHITEPYNVPHSIVLEPATTTPPKPASRPINKKSVKEAKTTTIQTEYNPGKYVASNRSNQYHIPICDWAKKIKPERQLWFKEKENAWERGFRAHSCIKE